MLVTLPQDSSELMTWTWSDIEPHYQALERRELTPESVEAFLKEWSALKERADELGTRLRLATSRDTSDEEAEARQRAYLNSIYPKVEAADQRIKEKFLASGLTVEGFDITVRKFRAQADLFRAENLPLLSREQELEMEYDKISGAQTVEWDGKEIPIAQLAPVYEETDRDRRERAWRLSHGRRQQDRQAINDLWKRFMEVRLRLARNAGLADYRTYRFRELLRLDYTPEDCKQFERSVREVVVPAAQRVYERRREALGLETLRPWDTRVDPLGREPLRPFTDVAELEARTSTIFHRVDRKLGSYFDLMLQEDLLDLDSRMNKAPGAYCATFQSSGKPFIFANAVGMHRDVETLLHESGHAFHSFERQPLPYYQQRYPGLEFAEVASMSMELLAAPYLTEAQGGFYSEKDAARARLNHLESILLLWVSVAMIDEFQHWIYENPEQGSDPQALDAKWVELYPGYVKGVEWSGLEELMPLEWHRILHIHVVPFYYIEYGVAQLGAAQVWANALKDQREAVRRYRQALALGGTRTLPDLYEAAGAKFAFDGETLGRSVQLIEEQIEQLRPLQA